MMHSHHRSWLLVDAQAYAERVAANEARGWGFRAQFTLDGVRGRLAQLVAWSVR